MDKKDAEVIDQLVKILEEASNIISLQLQDIEHIGRLFISVDENEANKNALLLVTKRNSLSFFQGVLDFLIDKIRVERQDFFIYYLPQIRVVVELYSYLQYLLNLHEEDQLILIIADTLYTLSSAVRGADVKNSDIQEKYTQQKKSFQYWLDLYDIKVPDEVGKFTKAEMIRQKLLIVPVGQRLSADQIKADCPLSSNMWKNLPDNIYEFYRKFSLYVHGNPLLSKSQGNENYWIISECLIFSSFTIELVNSKIINNKRSALHEQMLKNIGIVTPGLIWSWTRRKS